MSRDSILELFFFKDLQLDLVRVRGSSEDRMGRKLPW